MYAGRRRVFHGTIRRHGVNAVLDVPPGLSRAFAAFSRGGRIRVVGRLAGVSFTSTLVPVRGGRHLLYVNGGLRSAAGAGPGDRVGVSLRPLPAEQVAAPRDLAAALARTGGGARAFGALTAAHRRELVRWVDDARTSRARSVRIAQTVEHVLTGGSGTPAPKRGASRRTPTRRPLWVCPRCGNSFVTRNQYHSCARHSLEALLARAAPKVRQLFDRFRALVDACGPVRVQAYRDHAAFLVDVRFAGAWPRRGWLDVGFWLTRRLAAPRLRRVETLTPRVHVHSLRVTDEAQLDAELSGWIREAYAIGCRQHLAR